MQGRALLSKNYLICTNAPPRGRLSTDAANPNWPIAKQGYMERKTSTCMHAPVLAVHLVLSLALQFALPQLYEHVDVGMTDGVRPSFGPISLSSDEEDDQMLPHSDDELQVQSVRRLSPNEIRRRRMDAAREALRRAANAKPKPTASHTLLSSYKCPICLCPPTNISVTPCGHIFCGSCLYDTLSVNMRQENEYGWHEEQARESGYGENLFTPFGSGGALALANAAGASVRGTRGVFHELVQHRQRQSQNSSEAEQQRSTHSNQSTQLFPAARLRASNGTERIKGVCPVCRGPIKGGFTGLGRKGILGLDIMLGTPKEEGADTRADAGAPTNPPPSSKRRRRTHSQDGG